MPHWCVSDIFLIFYHPSGAKSVMNTIGLKFISNEAKRLAKAAISISKKILKTCLRLQYNVAVFPVYFIYGGLTYVYKKSCTSGNENAPSLEPESDVVVGAVKKLRNSALSGMSAIDSSKRNTDTNRVALNDSVNEDRQYKGEYEDVPDLTQECSTVDSFDKNHKVAFLGVSDFSGSKLMWDIPIISAKASYFAQCFQEKNEDNIAVAREALEQHSPNSAIPDTRQEFNEMIEKARNGPKHSEKSSDIKIITFEQKNDGKCNANDIATVDSCVFEEKPKQFCVNSFNRHSLRHKTKLSCNPLIAQNKIMCREIAEINKTIKRIQLSCSGLLGGLTILNEGLAKVISMKEKLTSLEFQVDEGKRLLHEVESDRFVMKSKLSTLEKLINEEEKYLSGDSSCESGFYENKETEGEVLNFQCAI